MEGHWRVLVELPSRSFLRASPAFRDRRAPGCREEGARGFKKKTEGENGEIKAVPVRERGSCRASDASCLLGHLKVVEYDVVSC